MTAAVSYWEFVLVAVLAPAVLSVALALLRGRFSRPYAVGIPLLVVLALVYTTPWESYLISRGVWGYNSALLGRAWRVPVEELAFIVLQTVAVGGWLAHLRRPGAREARMDPRRRAAGLAAGVGVSVAGLAFLMVPSGLYMGAIMVWAGPVLAVQWGFGGAILVRHRWRVLAGVAVPTLYFSVADRLAIEAGIWYISGTHTTGLGVLGLPVEEGLFFLTTTVFVVQGLILLDWAWERYDLDGVLARRRVPWPSSGGGSP